MSPEGNETIIDDPPRSWREWLPAFIGALGMLMAIPVGILLVGLPLVLLVRGAIEAIAWLMARFG